MTKPQSFEEQLQQLESIVFSLEKGELGLDDALSAFEKGVGLAKNCQSMLNQAVQKVTEINMQANIAPSLDNE